MKTVENCIAQAVKSARESGDMQAEEQLSAIGITNQRETTIVWDRSSGKPLHNAVVWLDTRTKDTVNTLVEQLGDADALRPKCGLVDRLHLI